MLNLLLRWGVSCKPSLPDHHPLYIAFKSKNSLAVRGIFKFTDAIETLNTYQAPEPFMVSVLKCNSDSLFQECMVEWTKWVREKWPHNSKHLKITQKS